MLAEMDDIGYDAEWQVLNSKDFGVPQNRERCFIIGHLRGRSRSEVFPVSGADETDRVCGIIAHRKGYHRNTQVFDPDGITETLDTGQGGGRGHYTTLILNKDYRHQHEAIKDPDGITGTLLARDYKDPQRVAIPVLTPERAVKRQNGRRFKEDGEVSFTLTAQDRHGVGVEVKPEVIGGIGEKNFGNQWRQGNRVYNGNGVATALEAHSVGNAGGSSNLYSVEVNPSAAGPEEE